MELLKEIVSRMVNVFQNWYLARQKRWREAQNEKCWQLQRKGWDYKSPEDRER